MASPDFSLLTKRRFAPLFVVQFLGAFNDNVLKFALLFLANFGAHHTALSGEMLATVSTGIFILPYFLFSAIGGQTADAIDKRILIRWVKAAEIAIMAVALLGFAIGSIAILLVCLFLMGLHSTIFGPVKYSILPQHLGHHEMMGATGLIEAGTFLAILGGQLLAGVLAPWEAGVAATALACVGFLASLAIPPAPPSGRLHHIDWNVFKGTADIIRTASRDRAVVLSILGISWFFAAGAVLVSEFAPLVSGTLGGSKAVVTLFLLVFSTAIAAGSLTVNRLLRGEVSARYVPLSAALMGACMIDLWASTHGFQVRAAGLDIARFFAAAGSWHILIGLAGISFAGGMFIVPLYAILSTTTPPAERSRVIAANNIANSLVTVVVVIVATAMIALGSDVPGVIGMLGVATLGVALLLRGMPRRDTA
ncbi:MFS transporter [Sphingomonas glacialis]|uniref:MFS transporter n=1 Tax=Sphingomonas glacialis TaxID=658225 RepID=UPI001F4F3336|nr:MFS transporter [Sphingomonas glacialis]